MVITKRLRGTWHAWHFQFALGLVVKVLCGHFCIACLRPLTRRYVYHQNQQPVIHVAQDNLFRFYPYKLRTFVLTIEP